MEPSVLLSFAAAAAALIWLPGPDWAFVVAAGTRERLVLSPVIGLVIGYVLMAVAVAAGIAPLVAAAPVALVVISALGAAYLIYLGINLLRGSRSLQDGGSTTSAAPRTGSGQLIRRGIGVSALNPKSLVLFVAFLPQFVSPQASWLMAAQLVVLGCMWAAAGAVFYSVLGFAARKALGSRPGMALVVARVAGVAMVIAGVALLGEQLLHSLSASA